MDHEARERAANLIVEGTSIGVAIAKAVEQDRIYRFVSEPISISKIPDPRCVAEQLSGKAKPYSRDDVLEALDACSR